MNHAEALRVLGDADGWFKSSASGGQGECVEVNTTTTEWVGVRDSKLGASSPVLAFSRAQWRAALTAL
ncbi:DUF397 domain-containing protein [Amycolatopsis vastitatis]|uniref:DUF397 domain-containing protein n=1 Tax=Amycolatopsis vastitatis TaxID=1905142 RepID=A0A229TK27_9PSEU|nr:DUF397 domain-containing protein [Amycolatopsis vastitatis]OXM71602.1 DUF397 domain-containing protein [Amycolatopsis vastitatis]